jgi:hypothetical protein
MIQMKSYKIYLLALTALSAVSCSKVIDTNETNFIGGDVALQTVANNEQAIVGAYAGSGQEMDILLNATFSDEVKKAEFYNAATTHEWQYTSSDITIRDNFTAINALYRVINRVNRVIDALPKADSTKVGDSALKVKLRGEALFLRAFSHFQLWRYYSGDLDANALAMVYMDYVPTSPAEKTSRITVQPYFDKLKADMAEAKNLVANNLTDVNRATKLAVSGLQARVALYLKDWPGAITFSTEYINGLPLATRAQFPGIWTDANNNEVAWKLKRTTAAGPRIGSLFRGVSANVTTIGTVTWAPSDKLWALFDQTNDIRFASYLKDEPALTNASPSRPSHIIAKYAGSGYATTAENYNDAKMFRTGEMYLIRAEAKAEANDATAADDLNALRAARITGYVNAVFPTKQDLINAIMTERFKELAFEGHRFWDLRRRGLPVERTGNDAPSTTGATLPAGNFRFRLPIPNAEIQANSAMQQNEGYAN